MSVSVHHYSPLWKAATELNNEGARLYQHGSWRASLQSFQRAVATVRSCHALVDPSTETPLKPSRCCAVDVALEDGSNDPVTLGLDGSILAFDSDRDTSISTESSISLLDNTNGSFYVHHRPLWMALPNDDATTNPDAILQTMSFGPFIQHGSGLSLVRTSHGKERHLYQGCTFVRCAIGRHPQLDNTNE